MQLSTIRDNVRFRYGLASGGNQASSTVLNHLINAAIRQVTVARDWDWNTVAETIATTAGTESYSRSSGARKSMRLIDTEYGRALKLITGTAAAKYRNLTGVPAFWWIEGGLIHLAPTPQGVRSYEHVYQGAEPTLVSDTDEPTIPDWAIDYVIAMACLSLARRLGDNDRVTQFFREVKTWEDRLADDARSAAPTPTRQTRRDWTIQGGF